MSASDVHTLDQLAQYITQQEQSGSVSYPHDEFPEELS